MMSLSNEKMKFESVIVGPLETNCYLIHCPVTSECAVVDPGAEASKILRLIASNELRPVILLNTHGHIDHIGANKEIKEKFDIPFCIHRHDEPMLKGVQQSELSFILGAQDSPAPDKYLEDGGTIKIGQSSLKVIHTPGHSPGSVIFLGDGFLLSGDTLFFGGVGRTDLPGGSWPELVDSIKTKILTMPDEMSVLPGHGPFTSVGQEKRSNPFIQ
jgi:glyoxylase-like metal-dependent hydrolase (beta-lactamase superfamily II)